MDSTMPARLRAQIDESGYYPDLVWDSVALAVDDEEVVDHMVQHEATFNRDSIHRHITVLVLTPTRLVIGHTDETDPKAGEMLGGAASSTESIPLRSVNASAVTRVVANPAGYGSGDGLVSEAWLTVGWGTMNRVELEPANCPDPTCDADHGLTGTVTTEDLTVRVSAAVDGPERVADLVRFGSRLQRLSGNRS